MCVYIVSVVAKRNAFVFFARVCGFYGSMAGCWWLVKCSPTVPVLTTTSKYACGFVHVMSWYACHVLIHMLCLGMHVM